jgi:hypothetical protein
MAIILAPDRSLCTTSTRPLSLEAWQEKFDILLQDLPFFSIKFIFSDGVLRRIFIMSP